MLKYRKRPWLKACHICLQFSERTTKYPREGIRDIVGGNSSQIRKLLLAFTNILRRERPKGRKMKKVGHIIREWPFYVELFSQKTEARKLQVNKQTNLTLDSLFFHPIVYHQSFMLRANFSLITQHKKDIWGVWIQIKLTVE